MSTTGVGAALISTKQSQIAGALIGTKSVFNFRGSMATTPVSNDDTVYIQPTNGLSTYAWNDNGNQKIVFALPKNSTLIGKCYLDAQITAGTTANGYQPGVVVPGVGPQAEYAKNVGDIAFSRYYLNYGSNPLQQSTGFWNYLWRRVCKNDVNIEGINATVLGGLPPGGLTEQVLIDAFYSGFNMITPLEWLFFVNCKDECWMPESLALEGQLQCQIENLSQCVLTSTRDSSVLVTRPTFTNVVLRYQEFTLSAAEKMNRLKMYTTPEGAITHFLDQEEQLGQQYTGIQAVAARPAYLAGHNNLAAQPLMTISVPLGNFRMDMAEILFVVRRAAISAAAALKYLDELANLGAGFAGSPCESNNVTPSLLTAAPIGTMIEISNYKLQASGKDIIVYTPSLYQRAYIRKNYHPDAQIADPIISIPFALFPEDTKNATGHQSASVLGQLTLLIQYPDPSVGITYQVDVWSHSHNLMQARAGGIGKALH